MCTRCAAPPLLSRRSLNRGLLASAVLPSVADLCWPLSPVASEEDIVEPAISLVVPSEAARTVALTLDACSGAVDMRIVDALIGLGIKATIFATGLWLAGNVPALSLMRYRADLFTLENHGERHLPPILGSRRVYGLPVAGTLDAVKIEVGRGAELIAQKRDSPPRWYRGAAGLYSTPAIGTIQAMGYGIAGYSLNADAGASLPAAAVARRIANARSGEVIVAHINQPHRPSGQGVADGIAALHAQGITFVGLDTLPTTPPTCHRHATHHIA